MCKCDTSSQRHSGLHATDTSSQRHNGLYASFVYYCCSCSQSNFRQLHTTFASNPFMCSSSCAARSRNVPARDNEDGYNDNLVTWPTCARARALGHTHTRAHGAQGRTAHKGTPVNVSRLDSRSKILDFVRLGPEELCVLAALRGRSGTPRCATRA